ncbi:unnamed protein product, partial [Effrenium voratum]
MEPQWLALCSLRQRPSMKEVQAVLDKLDWQALPVRQVVSRLAEAARADILLVALQ